MLANVLLIQSGEKSIRWASLSLSISNVHAHSSARFRESITRPSRNNDLIHFLGFTEQRHTVLAKVSCLCFGITQVSVLDRLTLIDFGSFARYQFLIYNASVIYFNCVRPFFRDGFRKHLCSSFQQVVDTLISLPEEHYFLWKAELLL